ncbi:MAG: PaaI family thioesterase [Chloroflexi bacterium]|nr:PaaI family thioesterase [Chloroflexota bacterium]
MSLQERYAPRSTCFGCGPANTKGLRIHSFPRPDGTVVVTFRARPEHEAFTGYLSGGIAGTLADCGMNWCAIDALVRRTGATEAPSTVTAELSVKFRRPIPTAGDIELVSRAVEVQADRVTVEATIRAAGQDCATARGTFVVVKEGHPAFHRW